MCRSSFAGRPQNRRAIRESSLIQWKITSRSRKHFLGPPSVKDRASVSLNCMLGTGLLGFPALYHIRFIIQICTRVSYMRRFYSAFSGVFLEYFRKIALSLSECFWEKPVFAKAAQALVLHIFLGYFWESLWHFYQSGAVGVPWSPRPLWAAVGCWRSLSRCCLPS